MSEFWLYVKLGFGHVLDWSAYDHVLFLIVLTLGYTFDHWKRILILISLFTLGHTVSLFLASFNVLSVNSRLVEFLIPLTILVTAIFNLFTAGKGSRVNKNGVLYATTIFFGLIHGLGFSIYFKHVSGGAKFVSLIEFALGIELAQIIVVTLIIIIGFLSKTFFRFSKRDWILVVSSIVIGLVIPMLVANKIW